MPPDYCSLANKKAIVTGSSQGIGAAIARNFANAGAAVAIHCRQSINSAEKLSQELTEQGHQTAVVTADVGDLSQLDQFVNAAWEFWGGIDVWVNNAGVDLLTGDNANLDYQHKLQLLFDVDVRSTMLLSRMVGQRMAKAGGGVILNIGWDQADRGMGGDSGELFSASKNAIMGGTRSLAVNLAPKVRVNCIAPGWIQTAWGVQASKYWQDRVKEETPLKRWGRPEDIANVARFLASDEAAFITGQVINVNGGAVR